MTMNSMRGFQKSNAENKSVIMKYKLYQEPYITIIPELEFLSSKRAKKKRWDID